MKLTLSRPDIVELNPRRITFTSGGLDRFEACPAVGVFAGPKRPANGAIWYGIFVHRFLEYATSKGADYAIKYITSKSGGGRSSKAAFETCMKIDIGSIPMGEAEVALAQDLETDEVRRCYGPHDRATPYEAYGKADLIFSDTHVHVADYKTGWLDGNPYESSQLLGLACSLRRERKVDEVKGSLVGVAKDGALHWNTGIYTKEALDVFEARMKRVHLRIVSDRRAFEVEGEPPEFNPGAHCKWCSNEAFCVKKQIIPPPSLSPPHTIPAPAPGPVTAAAAARALRVAAPAPPPPSTAWTTANQLPFGFPPAPGSRTP